MTTNSSGSHPLPVSAGRSVPTWDARSWWCPVGHHQLLTHRLSPDLGGPGQLTLGRVPRPVSVRHTLARARKSAPTTATAAKVAMPLSPAT